MGIKIAHITEAWSGGIATYIKTLMEHQSKSDEFEQISLIFSGNKTDARTTKELATCNKTSLHQYTSSRNPLHLLSISREINNILQEIKPDIVHLHSSFPGVYGRITKRFPTVYCAHGWSFAQEENLLKKYSYAALEWFFARRTDAVINISQHEYNAANKLNIRGKLNPVILNGVSDIQDSCDKPNLKIDDNYINIAFIGRLDFKKGFDIIEPFFRELQLKNIKLYVIGEAETGNKIPYQECKNITYLGWVNNKEIDSYIQLFDVIIVPSRYEGFALIPLEAMRNSKPVIISNRSSLPEAVIDGYNGYIFDLDNAEEQLTSIFKNLNKESLALMGRNAREVYQSNFTDDRFARKVSELYYKVLEL